MAINYANVDVSTDNFDVWLTRTNQLLTALRANVVTAEGTTLGNVAISGTFTAGVVATSALQVANTITANTLSVGNVVSTRNVTANTLAANVLLVTNATANAITTATLTATTNVSTVTLTATTVTANTVNFGFSNLPITFSNVITLSSNLVVQVNKLLISGGTTGHFLRASNSTAVGFAQLQLSDLSDAATALAGKYDKTGGTISGPVTVTGVTTLQSNVAVAGIMTTANISVTGSIVASGDITGLSDKRLKHDIQPIKDALQRLRMLTGYTFILNGTKERTTGLIAQELLEALPEGVDQSGTFLGIKYGNLAGLIVEAIKDIDDRLKALEAK